MALTDFQRNLASFNVADSVLKTARIAHAKALAALRATCPHDRLLETGWDGEVVSGWRPERICFTCGTEETGPMFRVLTGTAEITDLSSVRAARRGTPATTSSPERRFSY